MARTKRRSSTLSPLPIRMVRLHAKLVISALIGIALAWLAPRAWGTPTRLLMGWNVGIALYLAFIFVTMRRADVARIRKRAAEQDEGAPAILALTIAATIASLVAVVFLLGGSKDASGTHATASVLLAVSTILLSWLCVHTIFALHYAHEYYGEGKDGGFGGLNFPGSGQPDYWDFLYFSLVIGMTSQVSDVAVTSHAIRRLVATHGALSFFFNLTVLALTVNIVSNML